MSCLVFHRVYDNSENYQVIWELADFEVHQSYSFRLVR